MPAPTQHHSTGRVAEASTDVATLYAATAAALDVFTEPARRQAGVAYLRQRGIDTRTLPPEQWPLGYAPPGWTRLVDQLRHGFGDQVLLDAGLAERSSRGTLIDVFRDRVIFPIHTADGHVAGFIGRDLSGAPAAPKYLNTRDTPIYTKHTLLYTAHHTGPADHSAAGRRLVVVEGPIDVLAIAAHPSRSPGLIPVAACGTAFTISHARKVAALADGHQRVVVAMDGDTAGRSAATSTAENLRTAGLEPRIAVLPTGTDPADHLSRPGASLRFLDDRETLPLITFHVERAIAAQGDRMQWIEGRLAAAHAITSYLSTYPPEHAFAQTSWIAHTLDLLPATVTDELAAAYRHARTVAPPCAVSRTPAPLPPAPERRRCPS